MDESLGEGTGARSQVGVVLTAVFLAYLEGYSGVGVGVEG